MLKLCNFVISDLGSRFEEGSVFEHAENKMSSSSESSNCHVDTTTGNENDSKSKLKGKNQVLELNPSGCNNWSNSILLTINSNACSVQICRLIDPYFLYAGFLGRSIWPGLLVTSLTANLTFISFYLYYNWR